MKCGLAFWIGAVLLAVVCQTAATEDITRNKHDTEQFFDSSRPEKLIYFRLKRQADDFADIFGDENGQQGFGQQGGRPGFGQQNGQQGFGQPGGRPGFGQPGGRPGFGQMGAQPGFGQPGFSQPNFGQQGGQSGFGQINFGQPGQGGRPNQGQGGRPNQGQGGRPNQGQGGRPNPSQPTSSTTAAPATSPTTPSPQYLMCLANCPTTSEYNPICGSDRQVYQNAAKLGCAQRCGNNVQRLRQGNCAGL